MFSPIYNQEILQDNGVLKAEADFAAGTIGVLREYITPAFDRVKWRAVISACDRERLEAHFSPAECDAIAVLLPAPPQEQQGA